MTHRQPDRCIKVPKLDQWFILAVFLPESAGPSDTVALSYAIIFIDMANKFEIRKINKDDYHYVLTMMIELYMSPAVIHKPSMEDIKKNIDASLNDDIPLICYVFTIDDSIIGYSMIAKSFSTEYAMPCIWIEDLYIKEKYRHRGIGQEYFSFVKKEYPSDQYRIRLEVEPSNENAKRFYDNAGMKDIPYIQKEFIPHKK